MAIVSRVGSNQFSKRLRIRRDEFTESARRLHQQAALAGLESMIFSTRIDTSKAVSNWIVTRGALSRDIIPPYVPGEKGSTGAASQAAALAFGRAEIEDYDPATDGDLFITNNVPYLRYIDGSAITALAQQASRAVLAGAKLFK